MSSDLYLFRIKLMIQEQYLKIKISRSEILEKHPKWKKILDSMEQSEEDMLQILEAWHLINEEMKSLSRDNHSLRTRLLDLEQKNKACNTELTQIKNSLTL